MTATATNLVDQPWVPVLDHGEDRMASLRSALAEAHRLDGLGTTLLPVEREAMLRFLESLAAAVLRGMDAQSLDEARIPEDAVDRFFAAHAGHFDLRDPERPFMQEWHAPAPDPVELQSKYLPVDQLHLRVPGGSSASWGVTSETRDATDPGVLAILLIVAWFHGKPSNAAGASFYRPTSGSKRSPISGAPSGAPRDTVFHVMGRTLSETLLHSIPAAWLESPYYPAWMDQDAEPTPADAAQVGTLWRCTWTPNRALVVWDGDRATRYTVGLTQRMIPNVGSIDGLSKPSDVWKANAKAMPTGDYCRIRRRDQSRQDLTHPVHATPHLDTAEGFEEWYRSELSEALTEWVDQPRALSPSRRHGLGFHHEEGDTYGNRSVSTWTVIPMARLTVTGNAAVALRVVTSRITYLVGKVLPTLKHGLNASTTPATVADVKRLVYATLDEPVLAAVAQAAGGIVVDSSKICACMNERAIRAFVNGTETMLTAATAPAIHRSRAEYARLARKETK